MTTNKLISKLIWHEELQTHVYSFNEELVNKSQIEKVKYSFLSKIFKK